MIKAKEARFYTDLPNDLSCLLDDQSVLHMMICTAVANNEEYIQIDLRDFDKLIEGSLRSTVIDVLREKFGYTVHIVNNTVTISW